MVDRDHPLGTGGYSTRPISPLVGEMSAKLTEGGSSPQILNLPHTPLCPVGHLPHKGGDRWSGSSRHTGNVSRACGSHP